MQNFNLLSRQSKKHYRCLRSLSHSSLLFDSLRNPFYLSSSLTTLRSAYFFTTRSFHFCPSSYISISCLRLFSNTDDSTCETELMRNDVESSLNFEEKGDENSDSTNSTHATSEIPSVPTIPRRNLYSRTASYSQTYSSSSQFLRIGEATNSTTSNPNLKPKSFDLSLNSDSDVSAPSSQDSFSSSHASASQTISSTQRYRSLYSKPTSSQVHIHKGRMEANAMTSPSFSVSNTGVTLSAATSVSRSYSSSAQCTQVSSTQSTIGSLYKRTVSSTQSQLKLPLQARTQAQIQTQIHAQTHIQPQPQVVEDQAQQFCSNNVMGSANMHSSDSTASTVLHNRAAELPASVFSIRGANLFESMSSNVPTKAKSKYDSKLGLGFGQKSSADSFNNIKTSTASLSKFDEIEHALTASAVQTQKSTQLLQNSPTAATPSPFGSNQRLNYSTVSSMYRPAARPLLYGSTSTSMSSVDNFSTTTTNTTISVTNSKTSNEVQKDHTSTGFIVQGSSSTLHDLSASKNSSLFTYGGFVSAKTLQPSAKGLTTTLKSALSTMNSSTTVNKVDSTSKMNQRPSSLSHSTFSSSPTSPPTITSSPRDPYHVDLEDLEGVHLEFENIPLPPGTNVAGLTPTQLNVLRAVAGGRSVLLSGVAGTGKSFLLSRILSMLPSDRTFMTASTGIAALQLSGTTVHTFAGIGLGQGLIPQLIRKASSGPTKSRWLRCDTLVIDEVSMISPFLFSKLDKIAQGVRKDSRPFGGIQLILTGDFLQLPPVVSSDERRANADEGFPNASSIQFCFETDAWRSLAPVVFSLKKVFRQSDAAFVAALDCVRMGKINEMGNEAHRALIEASVGKKLDERDGIKPTALLPRRDEVEMLNRAELTRLQGVSRQYLAVDAGTGTHLETLRKGCPAAEEVQMKAGAQVLLLKNLDLEQGLANGSRGVVLGFAESLLNWEEMIQNSGAKRLASHWRRITDLVKTNPELVLNNHALESSFNSTSPTYISPGIGKTSLVGRKSLTQSTDLLLTPLDLRGNVRKIISTFPSHLPLRSNDSSTWSTSAEIEKANTLSCLLDGVTPQARAAAAEILLHTIYASARRPIAQALFALEAGTEQIRTTTSKFHTNMEECGNDTNLKMSSPLIFSRLFTSTVLAESSMVDQLLHPHSSFSDLIRDDIKSQDEKEENDQKKLQVREIDLNVARTFTSLYSGNDNSNDDDDEITALNSNIDHGDEGEGEKTKQAERVSSNPYDMSTLASSQKNSLDEKLSPFPACVVQGPVPVSPFLPQVSPSLLHAHLRTLIFALCSSTERTELDSYALSLSFALAGENEKEVKDEVEDKVDSDTINLVNSDSDSDDDYDYEGGFTKRSKDTRAKKALFKLPFSTSSGNNAPAYVVTDLNAPSTTDRLLQAYSGDGTYASTSVVSRLNRGAFRRIASALGYSQPYCSNFPSSVSTSESGPVTESDKKNFRLVLLFFNAVLGPATTRRTSPTLGIGALGASSEQERVMGRLKSLVRALMKLQESEKKTKNGLRKLQRDELVLNPSDTTRLIASIGVDLVPPISASTTSSETTSTSDVLLPLGFLDLVEQEALPGQDVYELTVALATRAHCELVAMRHAAAATAALARAMDPSIYHKLIMADTQSQAASAKTIYSQTTLASVAASSTRTVTNYSEMFDEYDDGSKKDNSNDTNEYYSLLSNLPSLSTFGALRTSLSQALIPHRLRQAETWFALAPPPSSSFPTQYSSSLSSLRERACEKNIRPQKRMNARTDDVSCGDERYSLTRNDLSHRLWKGFVASHPTLSPVATTVAQAFFSAGRGYEIDLDSLIIHDPLRFLEEIPDAAFESLEVEWLHPSRSPISLLRAYLNGGIEGLRSLTQSNHSDNCSSIPVQSLVEQELAKNRDLLKLDQFSDSEQRRLYREFYLNAPDSIVKDDIDGNINHFDTGTVVSKENTNTPFSHVSPLFSPFFTVDDEKTSIVGNMDKEDSTDEKLIGSAGILKVDHRGKALGTLLDTFSRPINLNSIFVNCVHILNQYKRDVDFVINHTRKTLHSHFSESSDPASYTSTCTPASNIITTLTATATTTSSGGIPQYPIVRFSNNVVRLIAPETFSIEGNKHWTGTPLRVTPEGKYIFAERTQIPLTLAWAVTIHKSQGMTLDKVRMDLSSVFETGQAYVALSRVRDLSGLSLDGLNTTAIRANPTAVAFYRQVDEHVRQQFLHAVNTGEMKLLLRKYKRYFTRQKKIALAKAREEEGEDVDFISFVRLDDNKDEMEGRVKLAGCLAKEALEKDLEEINLRAKKYLREIECHTTSPVHTFTPISLLSQDESQAQTKTSVIDIKNIMNDKSKLEVVSSQHAQPSACSPSIPISMSPSTIKSNLNVKFSPKRPHSSSSPIRISLASTPSSSFSMLASSTLLAESSNAKNSTEGDEVVKANLFSPLVRSESTLTALLTSPPFEVSGVSSTPSSLSYLSSSIPNVAPAAISPYPSSATLIQSGVMYVGALAKSLGLGSVFSLPQDQPPMMTALTNSVTVPSFITQNEIEEKNDHTNSSSLPVVSHTASDITNVTATAECNNDVITIDSQSETDTLSMQSTQSTWLTQKESNVSPSFKPGQQEGSPPPLEPVPILDIPVVQNLSPFALHSSLVQTCSWSLTDSQKNKNENFDNLGRRCGFRPPNLSFTQSTRKSQNNSQNDNISSPMGIKRQKKADAE